MRNTYKLIMDSRYNPLSNIPDTNTRHMVMQILAWMWCIIFSMWVGSVVAFGISAALHALLIAGVFITAGVFETAKRRPQYFGGLGRGNGVSMNKQMLFDGLWDLVKESDVDFFEVYVGDEGEGQIYIRFDNLVESEHE